jgi:hypothetical protein
VGKEVGRSGKEVGRSGKEVENKYDILIYIL